MLLVARHNSQSQPTRARMLARRLSRLVLARRCASRSRALKGARG
jgi:hypothetical protein